MRIEDKLDALDYCGLSLREEFSVSDLIDSWGRAALDGPGLDMALVCLGSTMEGEPWTPRCDNLWHFDTECIEGDGSYARIAERMAAMTQGSMVLTAIEDHVDIEAGEARLSFVCAGKPVQIDLEVNDDWVDSAVFGQFVRLLKSSDPKKLFLYYDLGGQDCIIGCLARDQFALLKKLLPKLEPLSLGSGPSGSRP